jgi:hypothetical protein
MNLLQILNNVLMQSSFLKKTTFTNNPDIDDEQMVAIANRVAYEIFNFYDWGIIRNVAILNMVVGQNSYPVPDDYQSIVPDSAWETDGSRKVDLPTSDSMWYQYKFSSLTSGGTIRARFYGDRIEIIEPFNSGSFTYEYISKYPIRAGFDVGIPAAAEGEWSVEPASPASPVGSFWDEDYWSVVGARKEFFTDDADTWLLDDQLLILGIQAHWQQAKQMPSYMEHMANYMTKMAEAIGRSNAGQTIGGAPAFMRRDPYTKLWVS